MEEEIVMHKGKPALVIKRNGKSILLKLAENHYKATLPSEVEPYDGDGDAVSLGLRAPEGEHR